MNTDHLFVHLGKEVVEIPVADVVVGPRMRTISLSNVEKLKESISVLGQIEPILVQPQDGQYLLVAGAHRLEVFKQQDRAEIQARFLDEHATGDDRRLVEVAENLHRGNLTALEHAEHVDEFIRQFEKRHALISAQAAPKSTAGRPPSGINAAAAAQDIERTDAQRARKIAALSADAKATARTLGMDDNQAALLRAAKLPPDRQRQMLIDYADRKKRGKASVEVDPLVKANGPKDAGLDSGQIGLSALSGAPTVTGASEVSEITILRARVADLEGQLAAAYLGTVERPRYAESSDLMAFFAATSAPGGEGDNAPTLLGKTSTQWLHEPDELLEVLRIKALVDEGRRRWEQLHAEQGKRTKVKWGRTSKPVTKPNKAKTGDAPGEEVPRPGPADAATKGKAAAAGLVPDKQIAMDFIDAPND